MTPSPDAPAQTQPEERPLWRRRAGVAGGGYLGLASAILIVTCGAALALTGGAEIQVNTTTAGAQGGPAIAPGPGGGFTVAWYGPDQDGDGLGVYARRFDAAGRALGGEFPVEATAAGGSAATIAPGPGGGFTVAWQSFGQDGDGFGVFARRFDAAGAPVGGDVAVNATAADWQSGPAIAPAPSEGFTVAWQSNEQDGDESGIYARRFDPAGAPLGGEIPVNTTTAGSQASSAIAPGPSRGFTVAWKSSEQDGDGSGVFARRFNAAGAPLGGEIAVNVTTAGGQFGPAIAPGPGDGFTVAWVGNGPGDDAGVYARRFDAAGTPLGGEIAVNTTLAEVQDRPAIAAGPAGGFTVVWDSYEQDGDEFGVYARRFDAAGAPVGGEIPVNTTVTESQREPALAPGPGDDFTVAWRSDEQDGDNSGVYARRFVEPRPPVATIRPSVDPRIAIRGKRLRLSRRGRVRVRLACVPAGAAAPCRGVLFLRTTRKLVVGRRARGPVRRIRIALARRRFSIAAGRTHAVILRLRPGKARLVRTRRAARKVRARAGLDGGKWTARRMRLRPVRSRRPGRGANQKAGR